MTSYLYDNADQLLQASTNNPLNPLLGSTVTTYSHDDDGNLKSRSDGLTLDYDAANHTIAITPPPAGGGLAAKQTIKYAGLDQTQRGSLKIGKAPETWFNYDGIGIGPSSEQAAVKNATPDYVTRTPGGGLVSLHRGGSTYFYITDRLGSVVALAGASDTKTGSRAFVASRYGYDPWGNISTQSESVPQPFKFAGAEYDASTGLYKMGARYYDPTVGRFTQLDALGGGYRYALNNPVNLIDSTGYDPDAIDVLVEAGGAGGFFAVVGAGIGSPLLVAFEQGSRLALWLGRYTTWFQGRSRARGAGLRSGRRWGLWRRGWQR